MSWLQWKWWSEQFLYKQKQPKDYLYFALSLSPPLFLQKNLKPNLNLLFNSGDKGTPKHEDIGGNNVLRVILPTKTYGEKERFFLAYRREASFPISEQERA